MVLDEKGTNLGRMPYQNAKSLAQNRDLDLIQVNKDSDGISVFKIMDYGKYKYEQKKSKQKKISHPLKEMNFKMRIDPHDVGIKIDQIKSFLSKGSDVKITVVMRGRERASPQLAQQKLNSILVELEGLIQVQQTRITKASVFVTVRPMPGKNYELSEIHKRTSRAESISKRTSRAESISNEGSISNASTNSREENPQNQEAPTHL